MLRFSVDSKNAFEVCLTDVAQTQLHGKSDVHLDFHASDTTGANENDSLLDLSFHIPDSNTRFNIDDDLTPAQFETESVVDKKLAISEELWADKYKDRLEASYKGLIYEVFTLVLRGLSGAKVSRAKGFHSNHDGYAMKATLKVEEGLLYPLEKGFFFLGKAPTFILYKENEESVPTEHDNGSGCKGKENLKRSNPELSFKDVGRGLKMRWDSMTEEEKEPYEAIAQAEANKRS
ncbi:hypothetical protein J5N97_006420 [Dioscorea zingiberensis]|uniref:FACT complex subunit SSRP1 n=1 Tax=Dioscorea zingiberensis TaxID=325984 RepID=A0A9D5DAU7_9LILI|nr:hypothetical protein J5N97_006420 [Dioscorea zingiberensis]